MKHRSAKDHGAFWRVAQRAFDNWPENHPARPASKENLIGWILIEVGCSEHRDIEDIDPSNPDEIRLAKAIVRATYELSERTIHCMRIFPLPPNHIRIYVPQSLSYQLAGKRKYEEARAKVYEYIETTLGVKVEQLMHTRVAE